MFGEILLIGTNKNKVLKKSVDSTDFFIEIIYPLKRKKDFAGAEAEIIIDDQPYDIFKERTKITAKKFIQAIFFAFLFFLVYSFFDLFIYKNMKNPFAKKDWSMGQVLNLIWLLISIPFVLYALYQFGLAASYNAGLQAGGQQGIVKAYSDVFQVANNKECAPFPINLGENKVELINTTCLRQAPAEDTEVKE